MKGLKSTRSVHRNTRTDCTRWQHFRSYPAASGACWRRRQIDPGCRYSVTQREVSGIVAGRGMAACHGGSVQSRYVGKTASALTVGLRSVSVVRMSCIARTMPDTYYTGKMGSPRAYTAWPSHKAALAAYAAVRKSFPKAIQSYLIGGFNLSNQCEFNFPFFGEY